MQNMIKNEKYHGFKTIIGLTKHLIQHEGYNFICHVVYYIFYGWFYVVFYIMVAQHFGQFCFF